MAANRPNQFVFVSGQPKRQRSPADNYLIRSRCMIGVNKKATSTRSVREAKRAVVIGDGSIGQAGVKASEFTDTNPLPTPHGYLHRQTWHPSRPRSMKAPVLASPRIEHMAESVCKTPEALLKDFIIYNRVLEANYLVNSFVYHGICLESLGLAALEYANPMEIMLTNSISHDLSLRRSPTLPTCLLLTRVFHQLNQKLTDQNAWLENSVIYDIALLALTAMCFGDIVALNAHLAAIHKILGLRGGLQTLMWAPEVVLKLLMIDLVLALSSGTDPYFLETSPFEGPSRTLVPENTSAQEGSHYTEPRYYAYLDPRLKAVLEELRYLSASVNKHASDKMKITSRVFIPSFSSIAARLLKLERILDRPIDECLCIGMLTFLASFFQAPAKKPIFAYLSQRIRTVATYGQNSENNIPKSFSAWLLILAAMSIVEPEETWFQEAWGGAVGLEICWEDVYWMVQELVWIDIVHDNLGKKAFQRLTRCS